MCVPMDDASNKDTDKMNLLIADYCGQIVNREEWNRMAGPWAESARLRN